MKKLLLPGILAVLSGCTTTAPSSAPPAPGKPAPQVQRYDDDRDDELDHDLSSARPLTPLAALS